MQSTLYMTLKAMNILPKRCKLSYKGVEMQGSSQLDCSQIPFAKTGIVAS